MKEYTNQYLQSWLMTKGVEKVALVLSNDNLLLKTAQQSVEHDNGFLKIVLNDRANNDFGMRVHVWQPTNKDSNFHSHRWNMASFILDGGYSASEYVEDVSGIELFKYNFESLSGDYVLTPQGKAFLRETQKNEYQRSDIYQVPKGEIHRITEVKKEGALSVVLSWGENNSFANVYSESSINNTNSEHRRLSVDEVLKGLKKAHKLISEIK